MGGSEPWWYQDAYYGAGIIGAAVIGLFGALRKKSESATPGGSTSVLAASVVSDKAVEKGTLVIREAAESLHDDMRRVRESMADVCDHLHRLERSIAAGLPPVANVDIAGLMARLDKVERGK